MYLRYADFSIIVCCHDFITATCASSKQAFLAPFRPKKKLISKTERERETVGVQSHLFHGRRMVQAMRETPVETFVTTSCTHRYSHGYAREMKNTTWYTFEHLAINTSIESFGTTQNRTGCVAQIGLKIA